MCVILAGEMTLIQIIGAYLRYLPFRIGMTEERRQLLWHYFIVWSVIGFTLNCLLFFYFEDSMAGFRIAIFFGWLPYIFIALTVIDGRKIQHLFVAGMQILWCYMLHAVAAVPVRLKWELVTGDNIGWQMGFYLLLFLLLLPLERSLFGNLLPLDLIIADVKLRLAVAVLPLLVVLGTIPVNIHTTFLVNTWERLSRLSVPLLFFLFYRLTEQYSRDVIRRQTQDYANKMRETELDALIKKAELMEEMNKNTSVLRHDLRHNYRIIGALLENGDTDAALKHIAEQEKAWRDS